MITLDESEKPKCLASVNKNSESADHSIHLKEMRVSTRLKNLQFTVKGDPGECSRKQYAGSNVTWSNSNKKLQDENVVFKGKDVNPKEVSVSRNRNAEEVCGQRNRISHLAQKHLK